MAIIVVLFQYVNKSYHLKLRANYDFEVLSNEKFFNYFRELRPAYHPLESTFTSDFVQQLINNHL